MLSKIAFILGIFVAFAGSEAFGENLTAAEMAALQKLAKRSDSILYAAKNAPRKYGPATVMRWLVIAEAVNQIQYRYILNRDNVGFSTSDEVAEDARELYACLQEKSCRSEIKDGFRLMWGETVTASECLREKECRDDLWAFVAVKLNEKKEVLRCLKDNDCRKDALQAKAGDLVHEVMKEFTDAISSAPIGPAQSN